MFRPPHKEVPPTLKPGTTVWYQQETRQGTEFFTQVKIEGFENEGLYWFYYCKKKITLCLSADSLTKKETLGQCRVNAPYIDRFIRDFSFIQSRAKNVLGVKLTAKSMLVLPDHDKVKSREISTTAGKKFLPNPSVVSPQVEDKIAYFNRQSGGVKSRLLATAKCFKQEPGDLARLLKNRTATVISMRLIEQLEA